MNISTADILKWDKELRDTVLDSVRNVMWYKLYEQYYLPKFWKKKSDSYTHVVLRVSD